MAPQIALAVAMLRSRLPLKVLSHERCPHRLRALISSCWEQDPLRRPAAAEVVKVLLLAQEVGGRGAGQANTVLGGLLTGH